MGYPLSMVLSLFTTSSCFLQAEILALYPVEQRECSTWQAGSPIHCSSLAVASSPAMASRKSSAATTCSGGIFGKPVKTTITSDAEILSSDIGTSLTTSTLCQRWPFS